MQCGIMCSNFPPVFLFNAVCVSGLVSVSTIVIHCNIVLDVRPINKNMLHGGQIFKLYLVQRGPKVKFKTHTACRYFFLNFFSQIEHELKVDSVLLKLRCKHWVRFKVANGWSIRQSIFSCTTVDWLKQKMLHNIFATTGQIWNITGQRLILLGFINIIPVSSLGKMPNIF